MSKFSARFGDLPPQSQAPISSVRGAIDSLVQGSLVDLFAAYHVAMAPLPRGPQQRGPLSTDISANVTFTRGTGQTGRLTLSLPTAVLELLKGDAGSSELHKDWARELANQLSGRVKNRLLQFNVRLQISPPASLDSKLLSCQLETSASSTRSYAGRTLRGEVLVTIQGMPDDSELVFVGASGASEGDLILF